MSKINSPVYVLLVEDNPADELLVRTALAEATTPVELALVQDGVEALAHTYAGRVSIRRPSAPTWCCSISSCPARAAWRCWRR